MAVVAHFEERTKKSERRRSVRRALMLGAGAAGESVTIRDISLTGMLLETAKPMLVGASFEVEIPHAGAVSALVVWNSGEYYGCEFDRPISPAAISAALLQSPPAESDRAAAPTPDPLAELRALNAEVECIAERLDRAIDRLTEK
jgi:hypothetical protein